MSHLCGELSREECPCHAASLLEAAATVLGLSGSSCADIYGRYFCRDGQRALEQLVELCRLSAARTACSIYESLKMSLIRLKKTDQTTQGLQGTAPGCPVDWYIAFKSGIIENMNVMLLWAVDITDWSFCRRKFHYGFPQGIPTNNDLIANQHLACTDTFYMKGVYIKNFK